MVSESRTNPGTHLQIGILKDAFLTCRILPDDGAMQPLRTMALATITGLSGSTLAEVLLVPEDFPTIQAAMDNASTGDVIDLAPGTWTDQLVWGLSGVTLRGRNGDGSTVIDGGDHAWSPVVCYGDPCTIEHITFRNGNGSNVFGIVRGGAIYAEYSTITITDCVFESNRLVLDEFDFTAWGGAIAGYGAPMTIERCVFTGNSSEGAGGAIYANNAAITVRSCEFTDNAALETGGGIAVEWVDLTVEGCTFRGNRADWLGGGIHLKTAENEPLGTNSTVTDCRFVRNNASDAGFGMGGGIAIEHAARPDLRFQLRGQLRLHRRGHSRRRRRQQRCRRDQQRAVLRQCPRDQLGRGDRRRHVRLRAELPCSVDADGDGTIGVDDLLRVLSAWGSFDPGADVDNDGVIGVDDLLAVIAAWSTDCE